MNLATLERIECTPLLQALARADSMTVELGQQAVSFFMPQDSLANKRAQEHAEAGLPDPWVCVDKQSGPTLHAELLTDFHYKISVQQATSGHTSLTFHSDVQSLSVLARFLKHTGREENNPAQALSDILDIFDTEGTESWDAIQSFTVLAYKWAADVAMTTLEVGPCSHKSKHHPQHRRQTSQESKWRRHRRH